MTGHPSPVLMITINVQRYLSFIIIYAQDYDDNINDGGEESQKIDQLVISTRLINIILIE